MYRSDPIDRLIMVDTSARSYLRGFLGRTAETKAFYELMAHVRYAHPGGIICRGSIKSCPDNHVVACLRYYYQDEKGDRLPLTERRYRITCCGWQFIQEDEYSLTSGSYMTVDYVEHLVDPIPGSPWIPLPPPGDPRVNAVKGD